MRASCVAPLRPTARRSGARPPRLGPRGVSGGTLRRPGRLACCPRRALPSCTAILVISLLAGAWVADSSGAVAVLGLLSVYLSSTECLVLVRRLWERACRGIAA
jgi:hypothetical protein